MYDINRAEYFYREIEKKDTRYPYLYFQLARIEFLKSRFNTAMIYINKQIELHGNDAPNAYYVRGLIEGYKGDYDAAAQDYGYYLKVNPDNWATANDYAWVLLKAKRNTEAAKVTGDAIEKFPNNAWLLSTRAIALYETGDFASALTTARKAKIAAANITEAQWLVAYPGNDPKVARTGITTLQKSIDENMHKVELAIASG
jgi:tetratricopeptide (TPR) repeat protein